MRFSNQRADLLWRWAKHGVDWIAVMRIAFGYRDDQTSARRQKAETLARKGRWVEDMFKHIITEYRPRCGGFDRGIAVGLKQISRDIDALAFLQI